MAKHTSGYSLIEVVVYAAILAALAVFVANTMITSFKAFNQGRVNRRIVLDADFSNLVLNSRVSSEDETAVVKKFFISGGRLAFQEGSGEERFLTAPNTYVSSFFVSSASSPRSQAVKISLVLEAGSGPGFTSRNFYTSAVLRGGY